MRRLLLVFVLLGGLAGCSTDEGQASRECSDLVDNDSDGSVDCEDSGCCGTWLCGVRCERGDDDDSAGRR